jgi:hypothetical protein
LEEEVYNEKKAYFIKPIAYMCHKMTNYTT